MPLPYSRGTINNAALCTSVCHMPIAQQQCSFGYGYYRTLIGSHLLEVKPTGKHGCMTTRSETVSSTISETFTRWMHVDKLLELSSTVASYFSM